ncbi:hypothetical protein K432DRAFT_321863 [Lepidopterella palustris CBS 459.81]|uniref:NAD(P)-binding domain-containing protein n=1 Tax=Lepidopterella palustris CBS 459.81 TaxID=1314670 RepID=A0A8E2EHJ2_9PEZI|nr:hypothetical protein K432DRAFT_321863 [Lepidopterella palustris CBS 459.81]
MTHNILLIGGHGKISQILTPLLLSRSWNVTSLIRSQEQTSTIERLGDGQPGKLSVLVSSLEEVKSEGDARKILEQVKPDWVVWSAGAGGRGGASRTLAIDRDAAISFTRASISTPGITKFMTVSYNSSRRQKPDWWTDAEWSTAQEVNSKILPTYYDAKVAADEVLTVLAKDRYDEEVKKGVEEAKRFCGIDLRPGRLTDDKAGNVALGKIRCMGEVPRASVAEVALKLLETQGARGWFDLLDGEEEIEQAVKKCVSQGVDCVDGEDFGEMRKRVESARG